VSSAILYAAIVAIWIGVLVPRWLRHEHARDGQLRLRRFSRRRDTGPDAGARAGFSDDGRPRYTSFRGAGAAPAGQAAPGEAGDMASLSGLAAPGPVRPYGWSAEEYLRQERISRRPAAQAGQERSEYSGRPPRPQRPQDGEQAAPRVRDRPGTADSERRARAVRGRRRMLLMLVVLTAIAVGLAYLSLAAWWMVAAPWVLLLGYLLLLREAGHADAEARERAAAQARRARDTEAQRSAARRAAQAGTVPTGVPSGSAPVWTAHETLSHAEIIDISERVGDQLYDQYADAKLRAVGG